MTAGRRAVPPIRRKVATPTPSPDAAGPLFSAAVQHYRAGRLGDAEQYCRRILAADAGHADSLHLLGVIASSQQNHAAAIRLIQDAIAHRSEVPAYYINLGNAYQGEQKYAEAITQYRRAIALKPDQPEPYNNLANALKQLNRTTEAVAQYRRALELRPDYAEAHCNLGLALLEQGQLDQAAIHFHRALKLRPGLAEIHNNLGNVLKAQGAIAEAIVCYQRAIALRPTMAEAWNNLGNAVRRQGRLDEAAAHFERALALRPGYAEAHNNRGNVLADQGKPAEAAAHFEQALALKPGMAEVHHNLGNALNELGRPLDAVSHLRHALRLRPDNAEAYNSLGSALIALERLAEAVSCLQQALRLKPDFAHAHHNLGSVYKDQGQLADAARCYKQAIALAPQTGLHYRHLFELGRVGDDDRTFQAARALTQQMPPLPAKDRLNLHFALGKAYADQADYDDSFRHLAEGNALKRRAIAYDEPVALGTFDRIRDVFDAGLMHRMRDLGHPSARPIFIIGMPRSGTTLVEQILASHPDVFGAGERTDVERLVLGFGAPESAPVYPDVARILSADTLRQLGERYAAAVGSAAPEAARIVDKMPGNFLYAGLIHLALPNARIIHVHRDPRDTCLSCFSLLFTAGQPYSYDLGELGRYYRAYETLMAHWRHVLPAGVMLDVRYEDVVADIDHEARRLVAHCGLAWDAACLEFHRTRRVVRTASAVQVRQPIFTSSIGRWRHYRRFLQPLLAELKLEDDDRQAA